MKNYSVKTKKIKKIPIVKPEENVTIISRMIYVREHMKSIWEMTFLLRMNWIIGYLLKGN